MTGTSKAGPGPLKVSLAAIIGAASLASAYAFLARGRTPAPAFVVQNQSTSTAAASVPSGVVPSLSAALTEPTPTTTASAAPPSSGVAAASSAASAAELARERSLLQRAHVAYRAGKPARALELAREHGRQFPYSDRTVEERTLEVLSLCALGRTSEASAVAGRLRAASGSATLSGLDGSCVSH